MTLPGDPDERAATGPPKTENVEGGTVAWPADPRSGDSPDMGTLALHDTQRVVFSPDLPSVPGYDILGLLGRGGMGVVYHARHIELERVVALKMILGGAHAAGSDLVRFRNEAAAAARLQHPGIVQIYEIGQHNGLPFFSLEYCPGGSLAGKLNSTPLPARQAAQLIEQLAGAIHAAHLHQVVHRDLKPGNVLLGAAGEPKISDFGLAKKLDEASHTQAGSVLGTPSYMAPEQADGRTGEVGPAADIYALGAILYELLTGRPPFKGPTAVDTIMQVLSVEPVPPIQLQPHTPRDLDTICLKCLQKAPANRYASAEALANDLRRFQHGEPILARPVSAAERTWRWCRRNPAVACLLAAMAFTLLGGITAVSWFAVEANRERLHALAEMQRAEDALLQSEKDRDTARQAVRDGLEKQLQAHLAEAQARRFSGQAGQRFGSLAALRQAVDLARRLGKPAESYDAMRNLAIASLALPDLRLEKEWQGWPKDSYGLDFDETLTHYARSDLKGNVSVRRLADDAELAHLVLPPGKIAFAFARGEFASCLILHHAAEQSFQWWNFKTNELTPLPVPPDHELVSWRVSSDSRRLVTVHRDGALSVFELPSGNRLREIRYGRFKKPGAVTVDNLLWAMHPFRHQLAIAMVPNTDARRTLVHVLDLDTGNVLAELKRTPAESVYEVSWHADGKTVAVAYSYSVGLWDVAGARLFYSFKDHAGGGMWGAMNRTGELMVSWSTWAGGMKVWHPTTRRLLLSVPNENVGFTHAAVDGRLAGYRLDGTRIQLWVIDPARECRTLVRDPVRPAMQEYRLNSIHKSGRLAAAGTANGVTLFDLAAGLDVGYLPIGLNWNVAFDPGSGDLLTSGQMGILRWPLQRVAEAEGRWSIGPPKSLPVAVTQMDHVVRISQDGTTIAAAQGHQALILHQKEPARRVLLPDLLIRREIALSPDGRWAATGKFAQVGNLRVWTTQDGALAKDFGAKTGMNVVMSPNGRWLLANDETHYRFYRMGTWEPGPQTPIPYKYWEGEPAFSPDSQLVALERGDGAVRLIETATGRELAVLEDLQQGRSTPISFSPDGTQLLLTNKDQLVLRVWDLRQLRAGLQALGLDWNAPPYPAAAANAGAAVPLTVVEAK